MPCILETPNIKLMKDTKEFIKRMEVVRDEMIDDIRNEMEKHGVDSVELRDPSESACDVPDRIYITNYDRNWEIREVGIDRVEFDDGKLRLTASDDSTGESGIRISDYDTERIPFVWLALIHEAVDKLLNGGKEDEHE